MCRRRACWRSAFLGASGSFLVLAVVVACTGVSGMERHVYESLTRATSARTEAAFREISSLGSDRVLLPLGVVILVLLPRPLLRRWWLWVGVTAFAWRIDNVVRDVIGRVRPLGDGAGFPSGHTTATAAFFTLLAYLVCGCVASPWARRTVMLVVAAVIAAVAVSRVILQAHWPLDAVGGALLGTACAAAAAWWNERTTWPSLHRGWTSASVRRWVYERRAVLPLPFLATIFVGRPLHLADDSVLDLLFDVAGSALILAGLVVRLWAAGSRGPVPGRPELIATGVYAHVRHPLGLAHLSIGLGVAVLAENPLALVVIPVVCIAVGRLAASWEDEILGAELGDRFARYCRDVPGWIPAWSVERGRSRERFAWRGLLPEIPAVIGTGLLGILADVSDHLPRLVG